MEIRLLRSRCGCAQRIVRSIRPSLAIRFTSIALILVIANTIRIIKLRHCMDASINFFLQRLRLHLKFFQRKLFKNDLRNIIRQVKTVTLHLLTFHLLIKLHWIFINRIWMHLLQLLDGHRYYFVYLENQECILTKKLPGEVFVPIMVH